MGFGEESKKSKAAAKAAGAAEVARQADEDAEWDSGSKKAGKKQMAAAEKAEAAAARKAERAELEAEEESAASAPKGSKDKKAAKGGKMTRAEIAAKAMAEVEAKAKAEKKAKKELAASGGNDYMGVLATNDNKVEDLDASGIDAAIDALSIDAPGKGGGRVNMKAAFKAFEEVATARIKDENPGLKRSQLQERVWAEWQKSPENPQNQQ